MKFFMPTCGQKLQLSEPWTFALYSERRNTSLLALEGYQHNWKDGVKVVRTVAFPKGTVLTVDRIYIRQGKGAYDSLTFRVPFCPDKKYAGKSIRFWARLEEVNNIECDVITEAELKALKKGQSLNRKSAQTTLIPDEPEQPVVRMVTCMACDHQQVRKEGAFFTCEECGDLNAIR